MVFLLVLAQDQARHKSLVCYCLVQAAEAVTDCHQTTLHHKFCQLYAVFSTAQGAVARCSLGLLCTDRHHHDYMQIDEEDLYSAVRRDPSSAEPDEHGQEEDALNADTFGAAAGNLDAGNGGAAPQSAWSSAGASLAVVGGGNRCYFRHQISAPAFSACCWH